MRTFIFLLFGVCLAEKVSYEQFKVVRAYPKTEDAIESLRGYVERTPLVDFWKFPSRPGLNADVMVPPQHKEEFESFLVSNKIKSEVFVSNVQELINKESVGLGLRSTFGWTEYHTLEEIESWLKSLADQYDEVELIKAGSTYEGRNITGVHVSYSKNNTNKAVFFETNIHAREWISSAVSTYILNELLTSQDSEIRKLAESYDWYFVPVANPDGFAYTHKTNRMWRKTRKPSSWFCNGVDPNRNWNNHWAEYGASRNPCSESYAGPYAFSENCTRTLSQYISTIGDKLVAYFDFHSYSQLLMVPYGYSSKPLDNYNLTYGIGVQAAKSLAKRYGTQYTVGNIYNTVYPASGGSVDWVKATFKTPLVYVYELRDTGRYGFVLPPDQIIPTSQETLDSVLTIFKEYEARNSTLK